MSHKRHIWNRPNQLYFIFLEKI